MKLVTYRTENGARIGTLTADGILDLQGAHVRTKGQENAALTSMQALIEADALPLAQSLAKSPNPQDLVPLKSHGQLLAPIPVPIQMRDATCFWEHMEGGFRTLERRGIDVTEHKRKTKELFGQRPFWYTTNRFSVVGPDEIIDWPSYSKEMDYELEMAVVIGRGGRNIPPERAREHIFGYTIFNDFSARDMQMFEQSFGLGPAKGKGFDNSNGLGPCLVTADEFDPYSARMISRINGEVQGDNNSRTITWRLEEVIAWLSKDELLHPGEIFCTGTVGGGSGFETGRLLKDGDVIELEIEGIGKLQHTIRAPHTRA